MIRSLVLAAALGVGAIAAAPAPASAGDVRVGVRIGEPGYYSYRPHYRPYYRPYRPYYSYRYRPAPVYVAGPRYGRDCRTVRKTVWDGYRRIVKTTRTCY